MTKKILFAVLFATGITRLVAWLNRRKVTILCYHSVTPDTKLDGSDPHKLHLDRECFLQHLDHLQQHYHIISLGEFARARRNNERLPDNTAVLTFDDGVRNFFTVAAPLLLQKQLRATVFIVTGSEFTDHRLDSRWEWRPEDDYTYLSWNEVRQLTTDGFEFGSHTSTHAALPEIPPTEARREMQASLDALNAYLPGKSFPLAYPHGRTSEEIRRLSELLGYSCAVTTKLGMNTDDCDLFALRRTVIASDDDLPSFAARLSGLTGWYSKLTAFFGGNATQLDLDPMPNSFVVRESQVSSKSI
jgi:peptidoglycan/xylan/chitin deacetylase (PgdA/CDA1 family)